MADGGVRYEQRLLGALRVYDEVRSRLTTETDHEPVGVLRARFSLLLVLMQDPSGASHLSPMLMAQVMVDARVWTALVPPLR